jgi:hypothetical protein
LLHREPPNKVSIVLKKLGSRLLKEQNGIDMATATTIKLSTADAGVIHRNVRADSAEVASQLLQEDMRKHHIFFNKRRFHSKLRRWIGSLISQEN